jgi:hypothetical protein
MRRDGHEGGVTEDAYHKRLVALALEWSDVSERLSANSDQVCANARTSYEYSTRVLVPVFR